MSRKLRERVTIVRTNKAGMERSSNLNYFPILFSIFMAGKLLIMWMVIVALDFACGFRLEYFWPVWLMLQSVADAYKYQGIVSYTIKTHLEIIFLLLQTSSKLSARPCSHCHLVIIHVYLLDFGLFFFLQGFTVFFISMVVTSDILVYMFVPTAFMFFLASLYVWIQYVWAFL